MTTTQQKRGKLVLPLRIDTDAFVVTNTGIVLDANNDFVAEYETIDEADVFVAGANGVEVATAAPADRGVRKDAARVSAKAEAG